MMSSEPCGTAQQPLGFPGEKAPDARLGASIRRSLTGMRSLEVVARIFYRQWGWARAHSRDVEFDVRIGKDVLLDDNGEIDVDGKAENFTKRGMLYSGCDAFQQEISTDDLDWAFVRVLRVG